VLPQAVLNAVKRDNLLENVQVTGEYVKAGLESLQDKYDAVSNVRGIGTFLSFDLPTTQERDALILKLRNQGGVVVRLCGRVVLCSYCCVVVWLRDTGAVWLWTRRLWLWLWLWLWLPHRAPHLTARVVVMNRPSNRRLWLTHGPPTTGVGVPAQAWRAAARPHRKGAAVGGSHGVGDS